MIKEKIKQIKKQLCENEDLVSRDFFIAGKQISLIFFKSMVNKELIIEGIVSPLIDTNEKEIDINIIQTKILKVSSSQIIPESEIIKAILRNEVVVFVEGETQNISIDVEQFPKRMPSEPPTSAVIQGPREGFTEDIKTNISLLRHRFPTEKFKYESLFVGRYTKTQVCLAYITDIADKKVVKKIKEKINKIDIDGIVDSHYLLSFLQVQKNSLFKQVGTCEKPDIIAAKMLEGRVAIFVDGSPIVLSLPFIIFEDLQNSNDYYTNFYYASFIRIIRAVGVLVATLLPGAYLALRLYHYKIVPLRYLVTISNSTMHLPFTPFIELLFILILFQILYEVSLRLPRYLGLATSIVGALILGDTGVKAGLISPPSVIIIALSLISIYVIPDQAPQLTVLRFIFILIGGCFGLFGLVAGMIYLVNYMNHLDNYGAPYMAPYSPRVNSDLKDALIKRSITKFKTRPKSLSIKNKVRMKHD